MRSLSTCTSVLKVGMAISCLLIGPAISIATSQEPSGLLTGLDIPDPSVPLPLTVPSSIGTGSIGTGSTAVSTPAATNQGPGPAVSSVNQIRVVLLKNDRCLTGRVRQLGDQVVIEIDSSARIKQPANEILFIGDDIEAVYRYKVSRYPRLGPGENIRLARWSMSNGLLQQASQHFLALQRDVGGDEPVVKQLGIELREQLLRDEAIRAYVGLPSLAESQPSEKSQDAVRTASTVHPEPAQPILPIVLSSYADSVQPILLKRCSQSGCHGLSSTNRLKFVQPIGNSRARISEQNCRSVLQFVNIDNSNMSTLVRYAVVAHGTQKSAPISSQETKLVETLQSWTTFARNPVMAAVDQATVTPGTNPAAGATAPAVYNAQSKSAVPESLKPVAPGAAQLRTVPQSNPQVPQTTIIPGTGPVTTRELDELDDQVRKALGEPPRGQTADPFDPAEFNRLRKK